MDQTTPLFMQSLCFLISGHFAPAPSSHWTVLDAFGRVVAQQEQLGHVIGCAENWLWRGR